MKYIDADRLRAEIKERTLFYAGQANLLADTTTLDGFDEVLALVDFLQQELPEVDLEKEIEEYFPESTFNTGFNYDDMRDIAHHFAQWQKEQMLKEAVDAIVEDWNTDPEPEITIPLNPEEFTRGDKVRVIIIHNTDEK